MVEVPITQENLPFVQHLIPEEFQQELREETLVGVIGVDTDHDNEPAVVLLCRVRYGWMEIVWLCSSEDYRGAHYGEELLEYRLGRAKKGGKLWGAFADLPNDSYRQRVAEIFTRLGFTLEEREEPVYTVSLEACRQSEVLHRSFAASSIVPISQADDYLKKTVVSQIRLDSRPVPLPNPMDWERYDQELSVIAMAQSQPSGLLLVSRDGEDFVLKFAWSQDSRSILAMLSYALSAAEKTASPDAQVLIAAITESAEKLVRAIFPSAQPLETTQAKLSFYSA
jgi:GNAT superfamily N-acetyltransferase